MTYRQKQKYYKVPKSRELQRKAETKRCIGEWWSEKVRTRDLFQMVDVHSLKQGVHYKGRVDWPDAVSTRVLYEEFLLSAPIELGITYQGFCSYFHVVSKIPAGTEHTNETVKIGKSSRWKKSRTLIDLPQ